MIKVQHSFSDTSTSQSTARSPDIQLIDRVDNAQLDGRIPYVGTPEHHGVTLTVSKHGLKITESSARGGNVIERVPLHMVAQGICYNDGWGRWNVAIKTGQVGKNQFTCHVFQTQGEVTFFNLFKLKFDSRFIFNSRLKRKESVKAFETFSFGSALLNEIYFLVRKFCRRL